MDVEKRFELKKWNAVALWSWNIQVESCAICKSHIMEPCIVNRQVKFLGMLREFKWNISIRMCHSLGSM